MKSMDWGMILASPPRGRKRTLKETRVRTLIGASSPTKIIISLF